MTFAKDIGIDLGTASVLVYVKGKGVVLNEPSVVAMDKTTGKLLKVGTDAQAMLGRTPGNIIAIRPLREGVISDYDMTERMLKEFIHKVAGFSFFKPRVIICVPSGITEVEERAVIDAGIQAGARKVYLIEEPVAAAIGAGIDITQPDGHMVVDIGGGTADIAVISLSGVVESASIKIAGDQLNEAVVKYMRRKHNLLVGERTAEEMKKQIGCVFPKDEEETMDVKGRCLLTGLPKVVTVSSTEMMDAFEEPVERIMEAIAAGASAVMLGSLFAGLIIGAAGYAFTDLVLALTNIPVGIRPVAGEIWKIFMLALPFQYVYSATGVIFRATRMVIPPLIVAAFVALVHAFICIGTGLGLFGLLLLDGLNLLGIGHLGNGLGGVHSLELLLIKLLDD